MFIHHLDCKSNFAYLQTIRVLMIYTKLVSHRCDLSSIPAIGSGCFWKGCRPLRHVGFIRVFQASSHIKDSFALTFVPTGDVILNLCCLVGFFLLLIFIIIHLRSEYFNTQGIVFGHAIGHVIWVLTDANERQSHSL